jgi:sugar lactone lactonase YvrE
LFFNETGNIDQVLKGIFVYPSDAGFTSAGDLVIADANEGILIFNADRQLISQINSFSSPRGLFVAPDDTLYVAETGKGRIAHVTLAGDLIESFTNPELYPQPTSVAVAPDGRIAIGDPVVGQVVVLDSTGQLLAQYPISPGDSSDAKPGVMWLADGGLMYTDPQVGKLVWVGNDGQAIQEWTELRRPNDLAQGVDGTIYVLESGQNRITKFTLP